MVHGIANSAEHVRAWPADVVSNRSNGNDDSAGDDERRDDRDAVAWSAFLACERGISPIGEYKGRTTKTRRRFRNYEYSKSGSAVCCALSGEIVMKCWILPSSLLEVAILALFVF